MQLRLARWVGCIDEEANQCTETALSNSAVVALTIGLNFNLTCAVGGVDWFLANPL